jgi:type I restriction enzyme M protein
VTVGQNPLIQADFIKHRARMLPTAARYETLLDLPSGADLGAAHW